MKRKEITIIIVLLLLSIALLAESSKALICELIYLKTDKETYYTDEYIELEVCWTFDFVEEDDPFFQIRIFDNFNSLIWNSSEFREKGLIEQNWTIKIQTLDLNSSNYSNTISIKAIVFNEFNGGPLTQLVLETKYITINKRNICCELSNFTDKLILGKNLSLNARFYSETTNVSLSGKEIIIKIISDNSKISERNYTLNNDGFISFNLSSMYDMALGINFLLFNITNAYLYNRTTFSFEILVEKAPVYVEILKYREKIGWTENLDLELFFYCIDNVKIPLKNQTIKILIYDNYSMNHQIFLRTDDFGVLRLNLSTSSLNVNYIDNEFFVDLSFNESKFLKDLKLVLKFEILTAKLPDNYSYISFVIIVVVSALSVLLLANYIYQIRKKKTKI